MSARQGEVRPTVSVIVPFAGDSEAARRAIDLASRIELDAGDELIVADNSAALAASRLQTSSRARVIVANGEQSSYHARNCGAAAATGEWLIFIDSDCRPEPNLIAAYFDPLPGPGVGALAGSVIGAPAQTAFLARYARSRRFLDQDTGMHTHDGGAATANLAVAHRAFEQVGGFEEGIRSGGDVDLCRRLKRAGWRFERRVQAGVEHLHRESLIDLLGSIARYSAGARWLNDRYPGSAPAWPLVPGLLMVARDVTGDAVRGRLESAAFRTVDGLGLLAHVAGYRRSNRVQRRAGRAVPDQCA